MPRAADDAAPLPEVGLNDHSPSEQVADNNQAKLAVEVIEDKIRFTFQFAKKWNWATFRWLYLLVASSRRMRMLDCMRSHAALW